MSQETIKIKEKDIVILRFPSEWPVEEKDLVGMMKTIRDVINKDDTIVNRFICLAKGANIETLPEEQFIQLWKNRFGEQSFEDIQVETEEEELIRKHLDTHGITETDFDDTKIDGSDYPYNTEFGGGHTKDEMEKIDNDNLTRDPNQLDLFDEKEMLND